MGHSRTPVCLRLGSYFFTNRPAWPICASELVGSIHDTKGESRALLPMVLSRAQSVPSPFSRRVVGSHHPFSSKPKPIRGLSAGAGDLRDVRQVVWGAAPSGRHLEELFFGLRHISTMAASSSWLSGMNIWQGHILRSFQSVECPGTKLIEHVVSERRPTTHNQPTHRPKDRLTDLPTNQAPL